MNYNTRKVHMGRHTSDKSIHGSKRAISAILVTGILVFSISGCAGISGAGTAARSGVPVSRTGLFFDTVVTVTLYDYEGSSDTIFDDCFKMCEHYESLYSPTIEGSDIWRINHGEGKAVRVDTETAGLVQTAAKYSAMSDGVLDLTVGGLCDLWDISGQSQTDTPHIPSDDEISKALTHIDHTKVMIDAEDATDDTGSTGASVTLSDPDAAITLGFIAKGYAADRLEEMLRSAGVKSALIDLGGNIVTIGQRPDGGAFRIGIQKPFADKGEAITRIAVPDGMSVVSSGIYERYFRSDGHIYHHILDTKTGYPADNNVYGVTVVSDSSAEADALSTLCLLLGVREGLNLIEDTPGVEAMFISSDYTLTCSSGWNDLTP